MGDSLAPPSFSDAGATGTGTSRSSASSVAGSAHSGESSARQNGKTNSRAQQRKSKQKRKKVKRRKDGASMNGAAAGASFSQGGEEALRVPHRDEGQVLLDVRRSFTGLSSSGRESPSLRSNHAQISGIYAN